MRKFAFAFLFALLSVALPAGAQTVSPLGGVGNLQFFNDQGQVLVGGYVYLFAAGTTTPIAVYVDSTGTTTQPNPVPLGGNGRTGIWLANGTFVKVILCTQNDGSACAGGDVLFSADSVPIGSTSSGGGGSPFTGIFISSTASPATSGTLRLSSGDSVCWRNAAGSTNLCIKKDSNDLFSLDSGSWKLPEVGAPAGVSGFDIFWADSTTHRVKGVNNGGTAAQYVLSGNDLDTTDAVVKQHFGATQISNCSTAPTTNQVLQFSGTCIQGTTIEGALVTINGLTGNTAPCNPGVGAVCFYYTFGNNHTLTRLILNTTTAPSGCGTNAVYGVRDYTSNTTLLSATPTSTGLTTTTGSATITAGDTIGVGIITSSSGCTTQAIVGMTAVYQ